MMRFYMGRAWVEIDLLNLKHNVSEIKRALPEGCEIMAVLKAGAYGHGALRISAELEKLNIKNFCVASISEAVSLRESGISGDILVLGYTHPSSFYLLNEYNLMQSVVDYEFAGLLFKYGKPVRVHIKIDTGMHRLGECAYRLDNILKLYNMPNLIIEGTYTHLCVSDSLEEDDINYTRNQISSFYEVVDKIKSSGHNVGKLHIQASYGVLNYGDLHCDYARVGLLMYGMLQLNSDKTVRELDLRPILSVKARVASVKPLRKGERVSYGLNFEADKDMNIAVLSIGYADGIPRLLSCGVGSVLINGVRAKIIGNICMDLLMVDISHIPDVRQGDVAIVIGKSDEEEISACDIAELTGTIAYEIICGLGERLERVYLNP